MASMNRSGERVGEIPLLRSPQWEESGVDIALQAINMPAHKQHIFEHLHVRTNFSEFYDFVFINFSLSKELMDSIRQMDDKCNVLLEGAISNPSGSIHLTCNAIFILLSDVVSITKWENFL